MQAVQSAMAVRRQRSKWEEHKMAKIRRESRDDCLSTPRDSLVSIDGKVYFDQKGENKTMFGQVTMFHVGSVFIVIGLMLVITALMPGYAESTSPKRKNDILGMGSVFVFIGCILTTVSRFVSNNEERELNEYIQSRLARSKSGHRLVRENESGLLTPKGERRFKPHQNGVSTTTLVSEILPATSTSSNTQQPRHSNHNKRDHNHSNIPPSKPHKSPTHEPNTSRERETNIDLMLASAVDDPTMLSKIIEEDEIECEFDDEQRTEADLSTEPLDSTPECSLTPTSLETQGLLDKNMSPRRISKTSSKSSFKSAC